MKKCIVKTNTHLAKIIILCLVLPSEVMMDANGDQSHDLLCFEERLPSSPGFPNSDSYMEYGTYATVTLWGIYLNQAYALKVESLRSGYHCLVKEIFCWSF